jgi:hypothetical protein
MATMASICMFFSCANLSYLSVKGQNLCALASFPHSHLLDEATRKSIRSPCSRRTFVAGRKK